MVSADIDEDGMLNADEFKSFTVDSPDAGRCGCREAAYFLSGKYQDAFFADWIMNKDGSSDLKEVA